MKRFKYWCLSAFSSTLYLVSIEHALTSWEERNEEVPVNYKSFSRGVSVTFLVLSCLGMMCWILPQRKIIQRLEVFLIFVFVSVATTMSIYSSLKPASTLALADYFMVLLPNVYIFGWFCVFGSVLLLANWYWHDILKEEGVATIQWCLLTATSFMVMVSSLAYRDTSIDTIESFLGNQTKDVLDEIYDGASVCELLPGVSCGRVAAGIVFGAVSAGTAIPAGVWMNAPLLCQAEVSFLLIILWVVGIAILTFENGQGRIIGNVFFGT